MGNTYGTWLPGDGRGWRSWRHREHCEGDYRNPPPAGTHEEKLERSRTAMKRRAVAFTWEERVVAMRAMGERLRECGAEVVELCVTRVHFHVLARFCRPECSATAVALLWERLRLVPGNMLGDGRDPLPRHVIGLAKKNASFERRAAGFVHDGGVWADKCKVEPIADREHQVYSAGYIREHVDEGAAVLSILAPEMVVRREE